MKKRKILTIAAVLLVTLNAGAFGFETVENAAEPVRTETDVNLSDTNSALSVMVYGKEISVVVPRTTQYAKCLPAGGVRAGTSDSLMMVP